MFFDRVIELLRGGKGVYSPERTGEIEQVRLFEEEFADLKRLNLTAIAANKLANIVCAEAETVVLGAADTVAGAVADSAGKVAVAGAAGKVAGAVIERAVFEAMGQLRDIVAQVFGTGGVLLRPYFWNGRLFTECIPQSRYFVLKSRGGVVTKAAILAEVVTEGSRELLRLETHELLEGGGYVIENRAFDGEREVSLSRLDRWAELEPYVELDGVFGMLFTHLRCPVLPRGALFSGAGAEYGVPITYGQGKLLEMIDGLIEEIPLEYRNKRAFIGAEDLLFDSRDKLPQSGLYKLFRGSGGSERSFWEVFSPEIRSDSYFSGLEALLGLLEKSISVNRGVFTELNSADATATAIRRSMFDTYNIVDAMRRNIEIAFGELLYAYGALGSAFGGFETAFEGNIDFKWSYALLEDSRETFDQLMEGYSAGLVDGAEVRRFLGV